MIRARHKLLLLVLFPFLILTIFLTYCLLKNYADIQQIDKAVEISKVSIIVGELINALQLEINLSRQYLLHQTSYDKLGEYQHKTDELKDKLKAILPNIQVKKDEREPDKIFHDSLNKLDSLPQKRNAIESYAILQEEVGKVYESLTLNLIDNAAVLADYAGDSDITRTLFAQFALLHIRVQAGAERGILYLALLNDHLSLDEYKQLSFSIAQQQAFKIAFFELATPDQEDLFKSIIKSAALSEANEIPDLILSKGPEAKLDIDPLKWWKVQGEKVDLLDKLQTTLIEENNKESLTRKVELERHIGIMLLAILATLGLALYFLIKGLNSLVKQLTGEIDNLATSNEEIGSALNQTLVGITETATAITETTTTVEELKQTAQISADKAQNVSDVTNDTLSTLKQSEKSLLETIKGMDHIQEGMKIISQSIVKLSENGQTISEIIDTVNDLAEQSHLLAINAAIEAAKAGEQGKGFAIVAQEVRNLADQSKQATVQVKNILRDIQNSTSAAVMAADQGAKAVASGMEQSYKTNEMIQNLAEKIDRIVQSASQIAVSSQQQLVGVEQVNVAMNNIKEASHQQVDHMQQIEVGIRNLSVVSQSLKKLVNEYQF